MKKISMLFFIFLGLIIITGCAKKHVDSNGVELKKISKSDLPTFYGKTYDNLLPNSIANETIADKYNNVDYSDIISNLGGYESTIIDNTNGGLNSNNPYEDIIGNNVPIANAEILNPSELTKQELTDVNFDVLEQNVNATGPIDMVYSNLASVHYLMQLVKEMNDEFENYGDIDLDGSTITIPNSIYPVIPDPLNAGKNLHFDDITAHYDTKDDVTTILVHTVNNYTYSEGTNSFSGDLGLYLKIDLSMNKNNETTVAIQFKLTCDLSLNADPNSGDIAYNIGYYVKAIENHSVTLNTEVSSTINLDMSNSYLYNSQIPNIDESFKVNSSFAVEKQADGIVADYKVTTDALDDAQLNYHVVADNHGATAYIGGSISDPDFYGTSIPSEAANVVFVYDENSQLIFAAGNVDLNIPQTDYYGNTTGTKEENYSAYLWNLNDLDGWTKIVKETDNNGDEYFVPYNNDQVLFSIDDQQVTFDNNDDLIEVQGFGMGGISIDSTDYYGGMYIHVKTGDNLALSLPDGFTSTHQDKISDAYSHLSNFKDDMIINFDKSKYQVPSLSKSLFKD